MLTCFDVANYFCWLAKTLSGCLTHMPLQKHVYYAQGFYLGLYGEPLFLEEIKAWDFGPVIPVLWQEYKAHGSNPIPAPKNFDVSVYSERQIALLDGVYSRFGHLNAFLLSQMTHSEPTWKNAYPQGVITTDAMKEFFETCLNSDDSLKNRFLPSSGNSLDRQPNVESAVESDIRKSKGFQAYLASKKERSEVYRRLAES
ncbi:Panacea domain-containing protein [Iningainema tapete]|uniref:DUF4065 domain-containing protein n=1 Tax=Iningainema tapete BLCC-T55 TaxID=2748662 RepID=A0A8J6XEU2_9CYAN|nr:type II toxin-antitoxin system antitoxin SocA domain-containing protein [Iningainema tapete]MBD2771176.1 DUF4065 domain-containing protein [Iningainema tapete BLCC-T55]